MTPDSAQPPSEARTVPPIKLWQILCLVILWSSGFKGARVASTLYALELGATPWDTGLLLSTYGLFPLLLAVYAGRVSDAIGVSKPLLFGVTVSALGVLLPFAWPTYVGLFAGAALSSSGFIFVQVGMQSLTGSLATGTQRTKNINSYALIVSLADLIGPVAAGFLIDQVGHRTSYVFLGLFNIASVAGLLWALPRLPKTRQAEASVRRRMIDLLRIRDLRRVMIAGAVVMTGLDLFQLYLPLYGHSVGLSASAIGIILGAYAAAGFATRAAIPGLVKRFSEQSILAWSLFAAGLTFVVIPFFTDALLLTILSFVLGLGLNLGQPLGVILTYNFSPPGRAGEALGLRIAINNSMHVIAPSTFGAIGSLLGLAPVFWVTAAFMAAGARYSAPPRKAVQS